MTKFYKTITRYVQALQVTEDNISEVAEFAGDSFLNGLIVADETDWIVKQTDLLDDEVFVLTDEEFILTYRE